ncbi:MAG: hypothetical protein ACLR2E_07985 [Lachnospiraceae bacterium]
MTELIKTIETKFAGYTAYFGFPGDNQEAIHFLADHGFQCIEQDWNNSFFFDGYTAKEYGDCIEKIFNTTLISSEGYITKIPTPIGMPTVSLKG